ncbi:glycosyltransferase [Fusobacterium varium]|uniref:glycosyltransferase n=1 Tax=Fusobacterium varium TaxID=856 RepID=UPI00242FD041|nr:glycosyltransferase [Fusobacterium varium]MCF0170152.1 glycosyltransferase [Fusobacterium varium]
MNKVLFIMDTLGSGGSQKILIECLNIFGTKYEVELLLINDYGIYRKYVKENIKIMNIFPKYKQIPLRELLFLNYSLKEKLLGIFFKGIFRRNIYLWYLKMKSNQILKGKEYKYIIGFQEGPSNFIAANLKLKSVKIGWLHSDINKLSKIQTKMEKNVYEKLEIIIAVSKSVKELAEKKYSFLFPKIKVLYNPINIKKIKEESKMQNKLYNEDDINILTIGRLSPEKGYLNLIEVISEVLKEYKNVKLYIIGKGEEMYKIETLIKKLKLEKKIYLLGFKENPYPYLKESNIYVSSSLYEGLPTTLIEAMIFNKMIVATKIPGSCEVLENYKKKYFVSLDSKNDFVEKIKFAIFNLKEKEKENLDINKTFGDENFLEKFEKIIKIKG